MNEASQRPELASELQHGLTELLAAARPLNESDSRHIAEAVELAVAAAFDRATAGGAGNLTPTQVLTIRCTKLVARELPASLYRARRSELRTAVRRLVQNLMAESKQYD